MGNTMGKAKDEPVKTVLFEREPGGVTYRIPALVYLQHSQTYLAFAEKRDSPDDKDAKVLVMRRGTLNEDGTVEWSPIQELSTARLPGHRSMNPCPVFEKTSRKLFLVFICVYGKVTEQWQIRTGENKTRLCCVTSSDVGQTWSPVRDLTDEAVGGELHNWATFGVGPGHGVQLENGRLVVPAYTYYILSRSCSRPCKVRSYALSVYSEDCGETWRVGRKLDQESCECEMAEVIDQAGGGHLYCNARRSGGHRCEAVSENSGTSFSAQISPLLLEPRSGCQGSVVSFPSDGTTETQTWLLFMHPTHKCKRLDMGVYLNRSPLNPSGWDKPKIIHRGPSGYSDLAYCRDTNRFSCLMECGTRSELEHIAFASFTLSEVKK
ncbi:sialidase-4-like isoform X1 [Synchiropus splendidus]|uniref:sialidase-4-like isoform X1 n=2 Tax=Synchiropus splendidus TaxID=270530 RepID=UPI00237DA4E2|nr:sialidase-4-like isoform X1 [Synchiropus splendidus]XP_053703488.1 sialidase-4-like isoform X1 [Synchiropus splendidus]